MYKDLTGQKFGKLTALEYVEIKNKKEKHQWKCICDCGKEVTVPTNSLTSGKTKSCGCLRNTKMLNSVDLTGKTFGQLTVIEPTKKRIQRKVVWKCKCTCGNICEVLGVNLTTGRTLSCGCSKYKKVAEHYREKCPQKGDIINNTEILDFYYEPDNRNYNECWVVCKCKYCGKIFSVRATALKSNETKSCGCIKRSEGETIIAKLLKENNILFETEKIFKDCYYSNERCKCRFDFYVNQEYIIEFDGKQHFKECKGRENTWFTEEILETIRQRDEYKNNWCKKHNIPLIRIPYYILENLTIEDLLLETTKYLI